MSLALIPRLSRWKAALLLVAAGTLLGVIDASQVQYDRALRLEPITWGHALVHGLPRWYAWALLAPAILWIARVADAARRRAAERGAPGPGLARLLAVHLAAGVFVTLLQVALFASASTLLHGGSGLDQSLAHLRPAFLKYVGLTFLSGLVTYGLVVAGWHAVDLYRRYLERERAARELDVQASELKALLAESRLLHLQSQLQPHFLFNTLHALSALVLKGESTAAVRMAARLSELLRRSLQASERPESPVAEELRLAGDYLEVQAVRFGARFRFDVAAEPGAEQALVPALLLQPLVENAVRHGVEERDAAARVEVRAVRAGERLVLRVLDDGPGPRLPVQDGIGLGNTRARLATLYGEDASLTLERRPEGGGEARVELPFRTAARAAAGAARAAGGRG